MDLHNELLSFRDGLKEYRDLLKQAIPPNARDGSLVGQHEIPKNLEQKREKLVEASSRLIEGITKYSGKSDITIYEFGKPRVVNVWDMGLRNEYDFRTVETLNACIDYTIKAIGKLEAESQSWGIKAGKGIKAGTRIESAAGIEAGENIEAGQAIVSGARAAGSKFTEMIASMDKPKVFIAHGGKGGTLDKLCEFLEALGLEPQVVELLPSQGLSVDAKVEKYIHAADCGVVLATSGGIVDEAANKKHPRLNVIDEYARLRAAFPI